MKPLFNELQQKTANLIATFSIEEIQAIERYFVEASAIMKETTDNFNNN